MAHSELEIGKKCQYTLVLVLEKNSFNFENSTFFLIFRALWMVMVLLRRKHGHKKKTPASPPFCCPQVLMAIS